MGLEQALLVKQGVVIEGGMEKRVPQKQRSTPAGLPDMDNDPELRDDPLDLIEPQNGKALTFKQRLFAEEYLVDGHGPMAALRAGFAPFGVYNTANRLLGLKRIRGYIARRRAEKIADTHMDQDWVLGIYKAMAEADMRDYMVWDSSGKVVAFAPPEGLTREQMLAVDTIEQTQAGLRIKLHDRKAVLDAVNRILGHYEKDNNKRMDLFLHGLLEQLPKPVADQLVALLAEKVAE